MANFENTLALIIEDDQVSVNVLQRLLNHLQVDSMVIFDSHNIVEALQYVERPDVVFLDLEMPAFNGYNVLDILRNMPFFDGVPVVAYTTHTSHMNEAQTAGFHSFLGKPLDPAQFPDQLARILNNIPVWEAS